MGFYRGGTITVTAGSKDVTGASTAFASQVKSGDMLMVGETIAIIDTVSSNTSLTLALAWSGNSSAGVSDYVINRTGDGWSSTRTASEAILSLIAQVEGLVPVDNQNLVIEKANPVVLLNKSVGSALIVGQTAGLNRWQADLGDAAGENGGNAGSDFYLRRFNDAGAQIGLPLSVRRSSGDITLSGKVDISGVLGVLGGAVITDDITTYRSSSPAAGAVYFGNTGTKYLYYDGAGTYDLRGGALLVGNNATILGSLQAVDGKFDRSDGSGYVFFGSSGTKYIGYNGSFLYLSGDTAIGGSLSKASGTFLIDHPLKPETHDLAHGFVESPRYELIYRGVTTLVNGVAEIDIDAASNMSPGTFAALTTNAVVTSVQNQSGFARVRPRPIEGASFEIICEDSGSVDVISWVVIAERNDPYVKALDENCDADGRFIPEREKEDA